jgi:ribonuclease Z
MDLWITFVGTGASVPTASRGTSATLVVRGGDRVLVDCGEGTQRQLLRSGLGLVDLDAILITHLHADHYLGLPGLLKTYALRGRSEDLVLIGPPGLAALLGALSAVIGRLPFSLDVREAEPGTVRELSDGRWAAFPTAHSVRSLGYALVEDPRPGMFDVAAATALGVEPGPSFGKLQRGESVMTDAGTVSPEQVLGPRRASRTVVITGDTEPCEGTIAAAEHADVLVHEATFLDAERQRARETRHSTAAEAASLAAAARVRVLALTHVSSRFMPRDIRKEAQAVFADTIVPRDFDQIEVPYRERGEPIVHPGGQRARSADDVGAAPDPPDTVPAEPDL